MTMDSDDEFERWLSGALDEPTLADGTFSATVATRVARYHRRRRSVCVAATVVGISIAAILLARSNDPWLPQASWPAESVIAALLLLFACCLVWVGAGSRHLHFNGEKSVGTM